MHTSRNDDSLITTPIPVSPISLADLVLTSFIGMRTGVAHKFHKGDGPAQSGFEPNTAGATWTWTSSGEKLDLKDSRSLAVASGALL